MLREFTVKLSYFGLSGLVHVIFGSFVYGIIAGFFRAMSCQLVSFMMVPRVLGSVLVPIGCASTVAGGLCSVILYGNFGVHVYGFPSMFSFCGILGVRYIRILPLGVSCHYCVFYLTAILSLVTV